MKAIALAIAFALCSAGTASAQAAPDEVLLGPVDYKQNVNGVSLTTTVNSYLKIETVNNHIYLKIRVIGDLVDLQQKLDALVNTFPLPKDNCASYSPKNLVATLSKKSLEFQNGSAVFSVGGQVVDWACLENPIPNSKIEWEMKDIVLFGHVVGKTKIPHVKTWPGDPIKTIVVTQPFDATLPFALSVHSDQSIGLDLGSPNIQLGGQYAFITKGILNIAGVDINAKASDALGQAIDPQKLVLTLPTDVMKYNPKIDAAHFSSDGGHLLAEVDLSAELSGQTLTDLVKVLIQKK